MYQILLNKRFVFLLFIVNLCGTIYGFLWYKGQLAVTPTIFLPFVPDSPTASMFFTIFLLFFLYNRHAPYIEALVLMSLFKYGIWAVIMNFLTLFIEGALDWQGYMLIGSHAAMAIQGVLYAPFYQIKLRHFAVAAVWILHNDIIDYVYGMMPIYRSLTEHMNEIGYFTFWLSVVTIIVSYYVTLRKQSRLI